MTSLTRRTIAARVRPASTLARRRRLSAYVLDARRCISYLTIELRAPIPAERVCAGVGEWVFGCDVCQDVCPWNHHAPGSPVDELQPRAGMNPLELIGLFEWDDAQFRQRFRDTPLWRAKRRGLLRNAAIVLGNQRCQEAIPALTCGLTDDEPLVRGACAWALAQIDEGRAAEVLRKTLSVETDENVLSELRAALEEGRA